MITSPWPKSDKLAIDNPPVNAHAWLNRAFALYRWARNSNNNASLTCMLKIQLRGTLAMAKATSGARLP